MITGVTITDDQIRQLMRDYNAGSISYELCALALCVTPGVTKRFDVALDRDGARARVAEIANKRAAESVDKP